MTDAALKSQAITLEIIREFDAPVEKVYNAFVDPAVFASWMGPEGVSVGSCALDVREGGAWACQMKTPDGSDPFVSGVYKEIVPNARLAFTWAWRQEDGSRGNETLVSLTFEEKDGKTAFRLFQTGFAETEFRDHHNQGWTSSFDCLEKALV